MQSTPNNAWAHARQLAHPLLLRLVVDGEGSRDLLANDRDLGELGGSAAGHLRYAQLRSRQYGKRGEGVLL